MPKKIYVVALTVAERSSLQALVAKGKAAARKRLHAQILLKADAGAEGDGWKDRQIVEAFDVGRCTVERARRRFVEEGLEAALTRRPQQNRIPRKISGQAEAHRIAAARGKPPEGRKSGTLKLLADRLVELELVDSVSYETMRRTLKKNEIKPWLKRMWSLPGEPSAEFVCAMQDVRDVYQRPRDPLRPQVCVDETSKQLVGEVRAPLPARPGQPQLFDHEYRRNGTINLFMIVEPLSGAREVKIAEQRTRIDWAHPMKDLVDVGYS
jgi:transposase